MNKVEFEALYSWIKSVMANISSPEEKKELLKKLRPKTQGYFSSISPPQSITSSEINNQSGVSMLNPESSSKVMAILDSAKILYQDWDLDKKNAGFKSRVHLTAVDYLMAVENYLTDPNEEKGLDNLVEACYHLCQAKEKDKALQLYNLVKSAFGETRSGLCAQMLRDIEAI